MSLNSTEKRLDAALAALPKVEMSEAVAARILAAAEAQTEDDAARATPPVVRLRTDWNAAFARVMTVAAAVLLLLLLPCTIALLHAGQSAELQVLELPSSHAARLVVPWQRGSGAVATSAAPVAHLSFDVGDGYAARAEALRGDRPRDAFALYNAFGYGTLRHAPDEPVSLASEVAACPWAEGHRLLRVQIETHRTLGQVAVSLELDPANVAQYRLIGSDSVSGAVPGSQSVRAGSRVIALFEITPRPGARGDLGHLVVSGDAPAEIALHDGNATLANASADFRFTAALAELAQAGDYRSDAITLATSAATGHPERLAFIDKLKAH